MKKIQIISLRVILLFTVAMFVSFIPDYLHDFFGDWTCKGCEFVQDKVFGSYIGCHYGDVHVHDATLHWGYRHWLFFLMGIILFIIQVVDLIMYIDSKEK